MADVYEEIFLDMGSSAVAQERMYRQFRDGFWVTARAIENNPELKARMSEHKVVYAVGRDAVVINEPFACERL